MSMNEDFSPKTPKPRPADTIYHIVTESPSLRDYICFGPFHCIEATVPSILAKLERISLPGLSTFHEILPQWTNGGIMHVKVPLGDGNHTLIRLVEEHNPTVAAAIPGPAWVVRRSKFDVDTNFGFWVVDVVGSYLQKEQAFETARSAMSKMLREQRCDSRSEKVDKRGDLLVTAESAGMGLMVHANFGSGGPVAGHLDNQATRPDADENEPSCDTCGAQSAEDGSTLKRCARCKMVRYCGRECQKADYKRHKAACRVATEASTS